MSSWLSQLDLASLKENHFQRNIKIIFHFFFNHHSKHVATKKENRPTQLFRRSSTGRVSKLAAEESTSNDKLRQNILMKK